LRSVGIDYAQGHAIAPPSMFAPPGMRSRHIAERARHDAERARPGERPGDVERRRARAEAAPKLVTTNPQPFRQGAGNR
ncbi:MAG TPA: hypothetical protein VGL43_11420, partial [Casimicrobiaceae bacterium]